MAADKPRSEILGGGFTVGSLVMVMEDTGALRHMLLLRNFMSQGLVHHQPLIYASPSKDSRGFLGTLPSPMAPRDDKSHVHVTEQFAFNLKVCRHQNQHLWNIMHQDTSNEIAGKGVENCIAI